MTIYHLHHIIPKHMGGTDNPSNLVKLTVGEHAEAHRKLYEKYGHWQDKLAWEGLIGMLSNEECIKRAISEGGRKGALIANVKRKGIKYKKKYKRRFVRDYSGKNNPCAKTYMIIYPNGEEEIIKCLKEWCKNNNINYNSFHKATICENRCFNRYRAKLI